ncbi:hypothetical protein MMC25_001780 [Agyrium rufum]|nr:hypothetical protein [Agyrium rufum]
MAVLEPLAGTTFYLWNYLPSQPASIIFIILFFITTTLHLWRMFELRSWFCIPFTIGCICEIIGYATRAASYTQTSILLPYIIQSTFLIIAPAFFAASIYMTLGRVIRCVEGEPLSIIRVSRLTKTFVAGDIMSLLVQAGAGGLIANTKTAQLGNNIVVAGLCIQLALLGLFFATAVTFQRRIGKEPTSESLRTKAPWKKTLCVIYTVSALIFGRSVFRVVEFVMGRDGYPMGHEWTLYVFDAVPMLAVTIIFWVWGPVFDRPAVDDVESVVLDGGEIKSGKGRGC